VQWAAFHTILVDYDATHKYAEKIVCCFGCGWKGEVWENLQIFKEREQQELYHCENSFFLFPTSYLLIKYGTKFSFSF
jgi:hypothetical protein